VGRGRHPRERPGRGHPAGRSRDRLAGRNQDRPAARSQDRPAARSQDRPAAYSQDRPAARNQDRPAARNQDRLTGRSRDRLAGRNRGHGKAMRRFLARAAVFLARIGVPDRTDQAGQPDRPRAVAEGHLATVVPAAARFRARGRTGEEGLPHGTPRLGRRAEWANQARRRGAARRPGLPRSDGTETPARCPPTGAQTPDPRMPGPSRPFGPQNPSPPRPAGAQTQSRLDGVQNPGPGRPGETQIPSRPDGT
jgi:hypothetical protein